MRRENDAGRGGLMMSASCRPWAGRGRHRKSGGRHATWQYTKKDNGSLWRPRGGAFGLSAAASLSGESFSFAAGMASTFCGPTSIAAQVR